MFTVHVRTSYTGMIPIKIQIKNFLSYGQELQSIDFSPYHLIYLSGKNGHGKSALLDAITWAIWGQARKVGGTAKADQGLVRLGQTHMLVILDFICNDTHYRIRREFALTYGKPYAAVDFGIVHEDEDKIMPLTEKTIRGTQKKIEATIRLDYDSFINSAFLRQGHANEFSKKSPRDRKEILANILGLQQYEVLRKLAHDTARQKSIEKQQLNAMQEKIATELQKTNEVEHALKDTVKQLTAHTTQEHMLFNEQKNLQHKQAELIKLKHDQVQTEKELQQLHAQFADQTSELQTVLNTWRMVHKQQLQTYAPEQLKKQKKELGTTLDSMQKRLQEKLEKKEAYLKAQQEMVILEQQLKHEQMLILQQKQIQLQQAQLQNKHLAQQLHTCQEQQQGYKKELAELQSTISAIEQKIKQHTSIRITALEQQFEKRRTYYQQWIAQANVAKNESDQIEQKKSLVADDNSPSCPLCEQNLSATRKKFLKQKLIKNEQFLSHRYTRLSNLIQNLKPILIAQHEQISTAKQKHNELTIEQHKFKDAQQKIILQQDLHKKSLDNEQLLRKEQTQQQKIIDEQEQLINKETATAEKQLHKDPKFKELYAHQHKAKEAYEAIAYDQKEHTKLREQLHTIEQQLSSSETMQQELLLQEDRKKRVSLLCYMLKELKTKRSHIEQRLKQGNLIAEHEKTCIQQEQQLHKKRTAWNKDKEQLLQQKGRLEQQQSNLKKLQEEHTLQQKKIKTLEQEVDDYQEIALALSKNGIQALLIEDAIPEIEQEANELLSRLTDNQATIFIESLRDLKSGGTKETLDIKISDAIGIRPYEMFSGGEAFRIDFSLRIAISKLLARRAGISLQTLIIDEGFGSQDEEGLSYIMDAIYKIQNDFKKVIIVSHLPGLKDQFPVHFHIQKNPQGSQVNIIEQA